MKIKKKTPERIAALQTGPFTALVQWRRSLDDRKGM